MQFGIVLAALKKHRMATFLIALEIALACGVLCNAIFLMIERSNGMQLVSGVDESALGIVQLAGFQPENAADINARVLGAIRQVQGVTAAGVISALPFGNPGTRAGVFVDEGLQRSGGVLDFYLMEPAALDALGLTLVAGRLPTADEYAPIDAYLPANPPVLVTEELAQRYWPGESALGRSIWAMDTRLQVIGVIEHLSVTQPGGGEALGADWSLVVPAQPGPKLAGRYVVHAGGAELPRVMRDVEAAVQRAAPDVVYDADASRSVPQLRRTYFEGARVMRGMLAGVIVALLGATALGIVGLASYWVDQRRNQIGIRRALGATRRDILWYFQVENFIIVSLGIAVGVLLAYGMNLVLMRFYELPRLPLLYVPVSALMLWSLGQLAVLAPALRAAAIAPVAAIRSL